ncbi:hypothetical protein P8452_05800 [Trifolium repens]|nr:hypothetical protein P8452_05800 [Trifolium repens]
MAVRLQFLQNSWMFIHENKLEHIPVFILFYSSSPQRINCLNCSEIWENFQYKLDTKVIVYVFGKRNMAQSFDLKDANFSFIVGGKLVMNNFNVNFKHSSNDSNDAIIKEFILKVESNLLEIVFRPVNDSGFGFVNGIEVFSAPEDLVVDCGSRFVGPFGVKEYKNLSYNVLETVHRINVGAKTVVILLITFSLIWIERIIVIL